MTPFMFGNVRIVEKHEPREYSAMSGPDGIVLCDKQEGAFLCLRCVKDLQRLKKLLNKIKVVKVPK